MKELFWENRKVLITGGFSFISSHLVDKLVDLKAKIRIADNLSSGKVTNLKNHIEKDRIDVHVGNLLNTGFCKRVSQDIDIVFHLAADHGGRGYVDLHQAACATNLALDGNVFLSAKESGVNKIVFASSGCVYPGYLQNDPSKEVYLTEDAVSPPYDSDNMYGYAKLMGELTLKAYAKEWGIKTASCRFFTVYGERGVENHAVIAMIARVFIKQSPFVVWGTGEQIRNWTYVSDIVEGLILSAEKIDDGTAINLGTTERITVMDAAKEILNYTKRDLKIKTDPSKPTGPYNRVADNSLAKKLLNWEPKVKFIDGLHRTIDWYFSTKSTEEVKVILDKMLTER